MCACGQTRKYDAITSAEANALIEEQRRQTPQDEYEAIIASAGRAIGNATSEITAQR
jgi:hypothetical protein